MKYFCSENVICRTKKLEKRKTLEGKHILEKIYSYGGLLQKKRLKSLRKGQLRRKIFVRENKSLKREIYCTTELFSKIETL